MTIGGRTTLVEEYKLLCRVRASQRCALEPEIFALYLAAVKAREVGTVVKQCRIQRNREPTPNWIVGCVKQLDTFYASKPIDLINVDGNGIRLDNLLVVYPE